MPRSKDPAIEDRDRKMLNEFLAGDMTVQDLADREGISRQRVYQIFSRFAGKDIPEEVKIDEHIIMLQNVRNKLYKLFMQGPQPKVDVRGGMIDGPDGQYMLDLQEYGNFSQTFLKVDESLRKLMARDLPRRKQLGLDDAQVAILAHIVSLENGIPPAAVHAELLAGQGGEDRDPQDHGQPDEQPGLAS